MNKYELLETIGEGAYGIVIKAKCKETGKLVAIKRFKESDEDELVRKTTLREVKILRSLKDEQYIVRLIEAFRRKGRLYLVFEYVGKNLLELLEEHPNGIAEAQLRRMVFTMLLSAYACHTNGVIHRDIKPENLLIAGDATLRLCDFGFARQYTPGAKDLTDYVATRWYRSPELLLGTSDYSLPSDLFAAGCIMAELIDGQPLFPGESEIDQMHLIHKLLGPFTAQQREVFVRNPRFAGHQLGTQPAESSLERRYGNRLSKTGMQLLKNLLVVDPAGRLSVVEALQHPYFDGLAQELCPHLLTVLSQPVVRSPQPPPAEPARPDTRGGDASTRLRSANTRSASMLPQPMGLSAEEKDVSMPSISSRPQSRGQGELPSQRSAALLGTGASASALKNIGAAKPSPVQPHLQHTPSGYGTPGPYVANSTSNANLRTGSGHGNRRTGSQGTALPKPMRNPTDVLEGPTDSSPHQANQAGFSTNSSGQGFGSTAYPASSHFSHFKPPQPTPAGNLPRLHGYAGLPPSGNGPAPTAGLQPSGGANFSAPYNPFLAQTRGNARQAGAPGRF